MIPGLSGYQHSSKEIIDASFKAIVELLKQHPEKDTIYYSVNSDDPLNSKLIGLGIFKGLVGEDVRSYISTQPQFIPRMVNSLCSGTLLIPPA